MLIKVLLLPTYFLYISPLFSYHKGFREEKIFPGEVEYLICVWEMTHRQNYLGLTSCFWSQS